MNAKQKIAAKALVRKVVVVAGVAAGTIIAVKLLTSKDVTLQDDEYEEAAIEGLV